MVSAATSGDRQHIGASAMQAAQSLRTFTSAVHGVCATRRDTPFDRLILNIFFYIFLFLNPRPFTYFFIIYSYTSYHIYQFHLLNF